MQNYTEQIAKLLNAIETVVGRKIEHPKDFDFLSKQIEGYVGEHISVSTLKRVWGYVPSNSELSSYTLNLLARMVGYTDWEDFRKSQNDSEEDESAEESSHKIICRKLFTSALTRGDMPATSSTALSSLSANHCSCLDYIEKVCHLVTTSVDDKAALYGTLLSPDFI